MEKAPIEEAWDVIGLIHDFDYQRCPAAADYPAGGSSTCPTPGGATDIKRGAHIGRPWG